MDGEGKKGPLRSSGVMGSGQGAAGIRRRRLSKGQHNMSTRTLIKRSALEEKKL